MSQLIEIFLLFARLSLVAFGSGSAILADMEHEAVVRGWVTQTEFVHAYAINQITPGPQMLFVAILGYYAAGIPGGIAAALGLLLPPAVVMVVVMTVWRRLSASPWPHAVRRALGPVGIGLIGSGAYAIAPASLAPSWAWLIFAGALTWLMAQPNRSPLWVVLGGAGGGVLLYLLGYLGG